MNEWMNECQNVTNVSSYFRVVPTLTYKLHAVIYIITTNSFSQKMWFIIQTTKAYSYFELSNLTWNILNIHKFIIKLEHIQIHIFE